MLRCVAGNLTSTDVSEGRSAFVFKVWCVVLMYLSTTEDEDMTLRRIVARLLHIYAALYPRRRQFPLASPSKNVLVAVTACNVELLVEVRLLPQARCAIYGG
jgi:hypothetical protein